jgi:hypothetical protein
VAGLIGVEDHLYPIHPSDRMPAREEAAESIGVGGEEDPGHFPEAIGKGPGTVLGESFGKGWFR